MNSKSKFAIVFSVIIMAICMVFLIATGIMSLAKSGSASPEAAQKGEVCEFTAQYASEALETSHSVNLIPVGKEHYYVVVSDDDIVKYLVRAKPSWIKKHFTADGTAIGNGQKIKGVLTRMDYDNKDEIQKMNAQLAGLGERANYLSTSLYIDMRYKEFGWLRIFSGIGFVAMLVLTRFATVSGLNQGRSPLKFVFGLVIIGVAILMLYTLIVGGIGI